MFSHCRARTGSAEFIALIANEALECLVEQGATIMPRTNIDMTRLRAECRLLARAAVRPIALDRQNCPKRRTVGYLLSTACRRPSA